MLVVLEVTMHGGKRPDGSLVSMVLTSTLHRCCAPRKNRSIPTISAGNIDGRLVHVSAVDTGPRGSESEVLTAEPGASITGPPAPLPDRRLRRGARRPWFDAGSAPSRLGSVCSTRVGIYWPRVVRTARGPHLPAVPPTLVQ